jgi:hypothetical protein
MQRNGAHLAQKFAKYFVRSKQQWPIVFGINFFPTLITTLGFVSDVGF